MVVIPCFSAKDANRKIDVPNEPIDDEPRFEGLLINLEWTDTGMDRRVLTRKLIVCPMGRGYVPSLMIGISCAHIPICYILPRIYIYSREREREIKHERLKENGVRNKREGKRCKEDRENDLHLPLLNFKLSQLFPSNPLVMVVLLTEACHPFASSTISPLSLFSSLPLARGRPQSAPQFSPSD